MLQSPQLGRLILFLFYKGKKCLVSPDWVYLLEIIFFLSESGV